MIFEQDVHGCHTQTQCYLKVSSSFIVVMMFTNHEGLHQHAEVSIDLLLVLDQKVQGDLYVLCGVYLSRKGIVKITKMNWNLS